MNIEKVPTIRVLREPDLRKLLDVPTAIEIIERTYKEYGLNDSHTLSNPPALYGGKGGSENARYKVKGSCKAHHKTKLIPITNKFRQQTRSFFYE